MNKAMDKEMVKEVIREMILNGEIELTAVSKRIYSNEGRYCGSEEAIILQVCTEDGIPKKQSYYDGVILNPVEITDW